MPRRPKKANPDAQLLRAVHELLTAPRRTQDLAALLGASVSTTERVLERLREGEIAEHVYELLGAKLITEQAGKERWHVLRQPDDGAALGKNSRGE